MLLQIGTLVAALSFSGLGCLTKPKDKVDAAGAQMFLNESGRLREEVDEAFVEAVENCPPSEIHLDSGEVISVDREKRPDFSGTGSKIFIVGKYAVKYVYSASREIVETLAIDRAFMKALSGTVPKLFEPQNIPQACQVRLMVSEFAGSRQMWQISSGLPWKRQAILFQAAAVSLDILRKIHNRGLIHGDVHSKNFVYTDGPADLKLIDFGRAEPFIDPTTGEHVPFQKKQYGVVDWESVFLSPWEIEGIRKTRRDDVFRPSMR